jgi:uncharacterized membrane-anchored protein
MIRYATLFIVTILIFITFNLMIFQKQKLLRSGETVYFAIAPSDPRSLMQGDYIDFRYKMENEIKRNQAATPKNNGYLVIAYDNESVGHFVRFYDGEKLAPNEKLVKYQHNPQSILAVTIKPHTFFFQENLQQDYQKPEYAIFHYHGEKDYLLVGLADNDKRRINGK